MTRNDWQRPVEHPRAPGWVILLVSLVLVLTSILISLAILVGFFTSNTKITAEAWAVGIVAMVAAMFVMRRTATLSRERRFAAVMTFVAVYVAAMLLTVQWVQLNELPGTGEAKVAQRIRNSGSPMITHVEVLGWSPFGQSAAVYVFVKPDSTKAQADDLWCQVVLPAGGDRVYTSVFREGNYPVGAAHWDFLNSGPGTVNLPACPP